jgi:streptogramin lyase
VWVANAGSVESSTEAGAAGNVMRFDRADLALPPQTVEVGRAPRNLVRTGDTIWVTVYGDDRVVRLDASTGQVRDAFCMGPGSRPNGITAADGTVYVVTEGDGRVHAIEDDADPSKPCT